MRPPRLNALLGAPWRPSSGSEWMDGLAPQIQQAPVPNIYPESPLVPQDQFDYGTAAGRVLDPRDVSNALLNPPSYVSEYSIDDLPGYIDVPQAPGVGGMLSRRLVPQNALLGEPQLSGRDQALAELAWEQTPGAWMGRQALGFGAGMVNPLGLTGWAAERLGYPETREVLNRADENAPFASAMGQAVLPTKAGVGIGTMRARAQYPLSPLGLGSSFRDFLTMLPSVMPATGAARTLIDMARGRDTERAQMQRAREYGAAGY